MSTSPPNRKKVIKKSVSIVNSIQVLPSVLFRTKHTLKSSFSSNNAHKFPLF